MRCIEAAAKFPAVHPSGPAIGVLDTAMEWAKWVNGEQTAGFAAPANADASVVEERKILGLPAKKK